MKCEKAQQNIVLVTYGELPDEQMASLEQHLAECEACNRELKALLAMHEALAYRPVMEPSPNLLAQSRMRLDEELDSIPPHGLLTRLRSNLFAWLGHIQGAPALVTLLVGVGFLAGNFTYRYQVAHQPRLPSPVVISNSEQRHRRQHQRHCPDAQLRDRPGYLQSRGSRRRSRDRSTTR
jgi:anti-sigma factor RsiW